MSNLNKILELIFEEAEKETHTDKVACLYAVLVNVNLEIGKRMKEIRNDQREPLKRTQNAVENSSIPGDEETFNSGEGW